MSASAGKDNPSAFVTRATTDLGELTANAILCVKNGKSIASTKIEIICGSHFSTDVVNKIEQQADVEYNISIAKSVEDLECHMFQTDVIICGGGTTLLEALFLGVPALVIPQTNEEKLFAQHIANLGGCLLASSENCDDLTRKFKMLESHSFRKQMSLSGRKLVKGDGIKLICHQLENINT